MREIVPSLRNDRRVLVYGIAIVICVFIGPFDTSSELALWDRLVFWSLGICAVGVFMEFCMLAMLGSPYLARVHFFVPLALGAALGGIPGTASVVMINEILRPDRVAALNFPLLWAQVSGFALIVGFFDLITMSRRDRMRRLRSPNTTKTGSKEAASVPSNEDATKPPRLLERLQPQLRLSQVISLSMQDHYVEVTTTKGSEMVLMRLSDAIDLMDETEGAQTHRSHWIAARFASRLERDGRKTVVVLSDGRRLPVSQRYVETVDALLSR